MNESHLYKDPFCPSLLVACYANLLDIHARVHTVTVIWYSACTYRDSHMVLTTSMHV